MKKNDDAKLLSSTPTQRLHMEEQDSLSIADQEQEDDELAQHRSLLIEHGPLLPIPDLWLSDALQNWIYSTL